MIHCSLRFLCPRSVTASQRVYLIHLLSYCTCSDSSWYSPYPGLPGCPLKVKRDKCAEHLLLLPTPLLTYKVHACLDESAPRSRKLPSCDGNCHTSWHLSVLSSYLSCPSFTLHQNQPPKTEILCNRILRWPPTVPFQMHMPCRFPSFWMWMSCA